MTSGGVSRLGLILAGIVAAGLAWFAWTLESRSRAIAVTLGPEEVVFDYSGQACDRLDVPDTPARAFRDASGMVQLLASHHVTRRMMGPDLDHLSRDCEPVMSSDQDPRPERFNDREWVASIHTNDGTKILALVHNEYQGHRHAGRCSSGTYRKCWYNSITMAVSSDGGRSYLQAEPPGHLVAGLPYRYVPNRGPEGVFSASNIVRSPFDHYYYSLVQVISQEFGEGTCVMRTRRPFDRGSWRAWNGDSFSARFVDPYRNAARHQDFCQPVATNEIGSMRHSLTFNRYLKRFLLIGVAQGWDPAKGRDVSGIYYSLSDDMLNWSNRRLVMEAELPWTFQCGDPAPVNYPSLLDPGSPSRTFEITSQTGYLYFTRLNYPECRPTLDRDLVRVPIRFVRRDI